MKNKLVGKTVKLKCDNQHYRYIEGRVNNALIERLSDGERIEVSVGELIII